MILEILNSAQVGQEKFCATRIAERLQEFWDVNGPLATHGYLLQCIREARKAGANASVQLPSTKPSAFALPGFLGRFYVLCPSLAWLWAACSCCPHVGSVYKRIRIYDNEERSVILDARDKMHTSEAFDVGDWVRIRSGRYRGDLGRVRETKKEESSVVVAVVPRIPVSHKRKRTRPDATLFDPAQKFDGVELVRLPGHERFMLGNQVYDNGLAEIRYSTFQISKTKPCLVDLGAFLEMETSLGYPDDGEPFLQLGDKVIDTVSGLRGRVDHIEEDVITLVHKINGGGSPVDIDAHGCEDSPDYVSRCGIKEIRRLLERDTQIRVMVRRLKGQIGPVFGTRKSERGDIVQFLSSRLEHVCYF